MHLNDLMISMSEQIHAGQHERSMDALSPCIAGGALAAISHIDFTYHCKIGSQFFREWRTAHTPLRPLLRLGDWNFGQGHDHELRNPLATSLAWSQRGRGQVPLRCRIHSNPSVWRNFWYKVTVHEPGGGTLHRSLPLRSHVSRLVQKSMPSTEQKSMPSR